MTKTLAIINCKGCSKGKRPLQQGTHQCCVHKTSYSRLELCNKAHRQTQELTDIQTDRKDYIQMAGKHKPPTHGKKREKNFQPLLKKTVMHVPFLQVIAQ